MGKVYSAIGVLMDTSLCCSSNGSFGLNLSADEAKIGIAPDASLAQLSENN